MAWVAPVGKRPWRVRYRDANGEERSVGGFRSVTEARAYAEALETGRRRGPGSIRPVRDTARGVGTILGRDPRRGPTYPH